MTPYEQLKTDISGASLVVQTPWLSLECEVEEGTPANLNAALAELHRYPICYIHPRRIIFRDLFSVFRHESRLELPGTTPEDWSEYISDAVGAESFPLPHAQFTWDVEEVIRFSRTSVPGVCDTIAAFSVLRKYIHESLLQNSEKKIIDKLERLKADPERFRRGVALLVQQNHHVTQKSRVALQGCVSAFPAIFNKASKYIESETGHDGLVMKALSLLGIDSESRANVMAETKVLVEILAIASRTSVLAFASMIEFFEAGSSSREHPVATLLAGTPFAAAAVPLQRHRNINVDFGHASSAMSFLLECEHASIAAIRTAVKLAEIAILVRRALLQRLESELHLLVCAGS
ncbi:MAG: hypothetical protein RI932_1022 [Pseudomonadota bacterium]|jgi:hypothetical protein